MHSALTVAVGRTARRLARLRGRGRGGSAFPGLVVERIDPGFLARTLDALPHGVVVVSGTNGKTTTTKIVVELLRAQGLKVFTNPTGSNFVRGVSAALLTEVDARGRLDADIAVLELDEAHAVHFVRLVKPRASLLLNVMRDQLDRFGEIDHTASLLRAVAAATTEVVVLNADDPRLSAPRFTEGLSARVEGFGIGESLRRTFLSDDDLRREAPMDLSGSGVEGRAPSTRLESIEGRTARFTLQGEQAEVEMALPGIHNMLNAAGALALVRAVLGERAALAQLAPALSQVRAAFGRGELIDVGGVPLELALVKNPAGFRMALLSSAAQRATTVIAINDQYADGRDMSWLWDVDFTALRESGVLAVTGVRAYDMALRLRYEEVPVESVEPDLGAALRLLLERGRADREPMRIYCTYTAMLALRAELAQFADVEAVL
ncbi:MurT ligase domain-containing protein [Brachybacterium sp. JHP9]|uniref:Lipid II isoglutaminyl synthase (glutamine-hydrolyzing) subunit MurT n=1 Tax=Brachybacterium equifaecis TaxID=2910770 RepID=A0ABT0QWQ7_9MICO|nr:Mur ligase family protein [Brachybacterium equifaecis]MCL6422084.1 MurT ligase domain-containing protein [Brachybacterium equifaecis]